MRRLHLFEWEDQPWLPRVFRDFITDHLRYGLSEKIRDPINRATAELLKDVLTRVGSTQIVDLCAGAGGPLLEVRRILTEELGQPADVLLTDLYPNVAAFQKCEAEGSGKVKARYESTSAFDVPASLTGLRTLFTALHHFKPEHAKLILADAPKKRQAIAVFEPLERTLRMFCLIGFDAFWRSILLTPWVGKLTWQRFLFTYVIPLAPAIIMWDGMVSSLRSYKPDELLALATSLDAPDYEWKVGYFNVPGPHGILMPTTYLIGVPIEVSK